MKTAFPVGKVQIEYMYPIDFEEFLLSVEEQRLSEKIQKSFVENTPLITALHEKAMSLYRTFLFLGGMPAVVREYIEYGNKFSDKISSIKADIITGYTADMAKYSENVNSIKILNVYHSIKEQLAQEQTKFRYKLVEEKGNKQKYETAIEWLLQAGLLLHCPLISDPVRPLNSDKNNKSFKLYLSDVGLLVHLANVTQFDVTQNRNFIYIGALTENFVDQTLATHNQKLYYWNSGNEAEVDFLLSQEQGIVPCEVKSAENVQAKSLAVYIQKYKPQYAIRISGKNFGFENNIKSVPLYAAHCL
jgi:predicted AAA+ superfamily ATPase